MSISVHVMGFRPADEKWKLMKSIWDNCANAKIKPPQEVIDFFDGESPGDKPGMEININDAKLKWGDDYREGYQIDVTLLPKDVRYLRFYYSV